MNVSVGVLGAPRCGSSMMMAMLDAGGIPPVDGTSERAYELSEWPTNPDLVVPAGRALKMLDLDKFKLPRAGGPWRFILMSRAPMEQAKSMAKFVMALGVLRNPSEKQLTHFIQETFVDVQETTHRLADVVRHIGPLMTMDYGWVLANPIAAAERIATLVGDSFDVASAAAVVQERTEECSPDMAFEMGAA